jgi:hypothetical protein
MSKPRWHPLPTDDQVVAAIEDRRESLRELYKQEIARDTRVEDSWIWHHLFTVLDHAEKIFKLPVDELKDSIENKNHI